MSYRIVRAGLSDRGKTLWKLMDESGRGLGVYSSKAAANARKRERIKEDKAIRKAYGNPRRVNATRKLGEYYIRFIARPDSLRGWWIAAMETPEWGGRRMGENIAGPFATKKEAQMRLHAWKMQYPNVRRNLNPGVRATGKMIPAKVMVGKGGKVRVFVNPKHLPTLK